MKHLLLAVTLLSVLGCASALKKECEAKNWFEHGKTVALAGKRLNDDSFIGACEKEGVRPNSGDLDLGFKAGNEAYCKPEYVLLVGKNGEFLNADLCDQSQEKMLKRKHAEGVEIFCEVSNGYPVGASGRVYNKICPNGLEKPFVKEYSRGRKVYLGTLIQNKEDEIRQLDREISAAENEKRRLSYELGTLPTGMIWVREQVYDPVTKTYREESRQKVDEATQQRRRNIEGDIDSANRKIREANQKQGKLRSEISAARTERDTLDVK